MATRILVRRNTTADWLKGGDPVLAPGEPGYDFTTGEFFLGDGATRFSALHKTPVTLPGTHFAAIDDETNLFEDTVMAALIGAVVKASPAPSAGLRNLRGMAPVAPRAGSSMYGDVSASRTNTFYMSQARHSVTSPIGSLAPVFANFTSTPGQKQEKPNPSPITVRAAAIVPVDRTTNLTPRPANDPYSFVATPANILNRARVGDFLVTAAGTSREELLEIKLVQTGNSYIEYVTNRVNASVVGDVLILARAVPLTFQGSRDLVLQPGSWAQADPAIVNHRGPADLFPYLWVRTYVTCASGGKIPLNSYHLAGVVPGDGVETGTTGAVDKTTSGVVTPNVTAAYGYGPVAIVGTTPTAPKIWAIRGDSIPSGQGDVLDDQGYMVRAAVTAKKPLIRATQGGERGAAGVGPGWRAALIDGATDVIWEYPTNDLWTGDGPLTAASVMTTTMVAAQEAVSRGARFWVQTLFPRNASSDAWATLAGQSIDSAITAQRSIYNDWVRAACPVDASGAPVPAGTSGAAQSTLVAGIIDVAATVENSRNDNLWKVNGSANYLTADGVHPTAAGHVLAAGPVVQRLTA